ncbi:MAG: M56 family metallopeptidase [Ilumatobacter fluminis]|uniref:M56 family metallopeptidase n=1 Tax=Ilumatobacter fluminis TaxID=467091 RepID=UPI0032F005F1
MTVLATVSPLLTALAIAVVVTALHRRVRPQLAAALLTGGILGVAVAVVPTLVVLAVGFLVHLPFLGGGFEWCRAALGFHASVNPWLGAAAAMTLAFGVVRVVRSVRAWRRHRCAEAGAPALVTSDDWFAYSLPGPGRRIAVSSGLVDALDGEELEVVLAHERGHARHRHDRQLLVAELAAGLVPPLEWLRRRLRFALERWADEEAVTAAGGDRERVAFTLAKVALGPSEAPRTVAAFNGLGVAARVEALLRPQPLRHEGFWTSTIGLGVVAVALAAAVQAHHVVALVVTLCPG